MRTVVFVVAALVLALGCKKQEDPTASKADEQAKTDPQPAKADDEQPAAGDDDQKDEPDPKEVEAAAAVGDGPTGIAACDQYLQKYQSCLQAKVPEEAREAMTEAFEAQRDAWVQSAEAASGNDEVSAQLAKNCKEALDAAKVPMEQYGCEW